MRRVPRLVRQPSAIQRVTGALSASRALRPLDSLLAVRILDNRGRELSGVTVHWTLANAGDGAVIRVINAATDSAGLSRAEFTPGRSADPQSVIAEVPGVGRIDFAVTIPAATLSVVARDITIWAGDDTLLVAEVHDDAGNALAGGSVSWFSADTAVIRVAQTDGPRARITGGLAGTTQILAFAEAGSVRASGRVTVRPVLAGRFITIDGRAPPEMRMRLRAEGVTQSIPVQDGAFSARVDLSRGAEADVHASPVSGTTAYHEVNLRVRNQRDLQRLVIALVPITFRIDTGTYLGQTVTINALRAMQRVGNTAAFWRLVPLSGQGPRKLLGWRESDLPLRIAFNRAASRESVSAADSTAFWTIAEAMEKDLGKTLFVPAEPGDSLRGTVVRVEIRDQPSDGHTFVSWERAGDANDAILLFRRAATLRDAHVVTHELVHLLGFGHTTAWQTISQPVAGSQRGLTASDVAYIQLAMLLRRRQKEIGALPGLPVASRELP